MTATGGTLGSGRPAAPPSTDRRTACLPTVLQRLAEEDTRGADVPSLRYRPIRHEDRPFSHLDWVAVEDGQGRPTRRLFVKSLKPKTDDGGVEKMRRRVQHEFDTTTRVYEAMSGERHFGVIRPVACYPDLLTIVTEETRADNLLDHLEREGAWRPSEQMLSSLEAVLSRVGQWLGVFQSIDLVGGPVSLVELREYVDVRLERLVAASGVRFEESNRQALLDHIDRLAAVVPASALDEVLIHSDFAAGNILVDGDRIVVLDFAMARRGTRLHDITRLFLQLDVLRAKPKFRPRVVDRLQRALLGGFDPSLSPADPLFRLLVLLHRVNNFGSLSLRPGRFPENLYNAWVCRMHRKALAREIATPVSLGRAVQ